MKTLKEIKEGFIKENDDKKLTSLIRAGLFDIKKLPLLRRALSKDNTKMTPAERNSLLDLLDTLISHVLGDTSVYNKVKTNVMHESYEVAGDLPQILILKRKSIRVFPDGQRVALYWSDKLKTYVSVPYSSVGVGYSPSVSEEKETKMDNLSRLIDIKESGQPATLKFLDGTEMECNEEMATEILDTFALMDEQNKSMITFLVDEGKDSFTEVLNFLKE